MQGGRGGSVEAKSPVSKPGEGRGGGLSSRLLVEMQVYEYCLVQARLSALTAAAENT